MTMLVPSIVANAIVESTDVTDNVGLLAISGLPFRSAQYLLGETTLNDRGLDRVDGSLALLVTLAIIAALSAFTWWRYQQLEVGR